MDKIFTFTDRQAFREWLGKYGTENDGIWLLFSKKGKFVTLSAGDALEEALCHGWIDGQMQSLDDNTYKKYFARRIPESKWSVKNKKMVKNYYYLIVGVLCLLFAITHTLNGVTTSLQILENSVIENNTKVAFTYVWHIIGIENLVFGIALLIMAFQKKMSIVKFATWLIIMILTMRWMVITLFTLLNNSGNVIPLIPDTAAIFVVIVLLFLGTKVKDKIPNE